MIQNTNYGASKTYVNTKVDKLTTSGLKAYTHDGATQGEIAISNTYTPATLALRDSNGRLVAADPASGATDKSLVTANWVSQTGNNAPNNLIHKTGNENRSNGVLTTQYMGMQLPTIMTPSATGVWVRWVKVTSAYSENNIIEMLGRNANNGAFYAMFSVAGGGAFSRYAKIIDAGPNLAGFKVVIMRNTSDNAHEIWIYAAQTQLAYITTGLKYGNPVRFVEINEEYATLPSTGYTTPFYVVGSA